MNLTTAVGCSALLHLGLLAVRPPGDWVPPREALHTLEVTYWPAKAAAQNRQAPAPRPAAAPSLPSRPPEAAKPAKPVPPTSANRPRPVVKPVPDPAETMAARPTVPAASTHAVRLPPEGAFARLQHKQRVKEHLRTHLQYPFPGSQGWVRLQLSLDRMGTLTLVRVLESSHPLLAQRASEDARSAVPYPSFPRSLGGQQARYEFLVQYEPE